MLYGQIKTSNENFYKEHEGALEGSLRGVLTGGLVGALKEHKIRYTNWHDRLKNGLFGAIVGGVSGGGVGHYLDTHRPQISEAVNALVSKFRSSDK